MSSLGRSQICHCGHDRATHFEQKYTCLGMLCACPEYVHEDAPKPVPKKVATKAVPPEDDVHYGFGWMGPFGPGTP